MPRFQTALQELPTDLAELATTVQLAQREVFDEGGGTITVLEDPAARVLLHALATRLNTLAIDTETFLYTELRDLVGLKSKSTPDPSDPAPRRYADAEAAQEGAGNVGALCGTIAQHAKALQDSGLDPALDPAIRMIGHQVASLNSIAYASEADLDSWKHACRAVVAAGQARSVLDEISNNGASLQAAP